MSSRRRSRVKAASPPAAPKAIRTERTGPSLWVGFVAIALLAYLPVWHGGMLWDDDGHITRSDLRDGHGLWRIWFEPGATQQYYPLVHSVFWLQFKLWGQDPLGYHLLNIVLHATSAFLLVVILRRLAIPGAVLAGVLFALHPVNVESVAWMTELKNTLSGVLYFSAALAYVRFDERRETRFYALALSLFVLALLSKTVAATLPAGLLVVFWWKRGALNWRRDVAPLIPFFLLGLTAGVVTSWVERHFIGAQGAAFEFTLIERGLIAGRALVFYLGKLIWPLNLVFSYPRWHISQSVWWQYLFPLGVAGLGAALWWLRRRTRAPFAAMAYFALTLGPALGFVNVYPFKYSFVADHFQYLASVGVLTLVAATVARILQRRAPHAAWTAQAGVALAFALPLGVLTWQQSRQYANATTLYLETLRRNPSSWLAENNLGIAKMHGSPADRQEAFERFERALRIDPNEPIIQNNMGEALRLMGKPAEALEHYQKALQVAPGYAEAYANLGADLQMLGRLEEAVVAYRRALSIKPELSAARSDLGITLGRLGQRDQGLIELREAVKFSPEDFQNRIALADALRDADRTGDAIVEYEAALRIDAAAIEARSHLAYLLWRAGRLNEAEIQLRELLRVRPDRAADHDNLGNVLQASNRVEEAVTEYEVALKLESGARRPEIHSDLGVALAKLGRRDAAIAQFQEALRLQPDFPAARANLAKLLGPPR